MRKVKASHNSAQVQHLYESYFLLLKKPALSEVQGYVFDFLLKHLLIRDNTFDWIRSWAMRCIKWKSRTKIVENPESYDDLGRVSKIICITIAKSSFTLFDIREFSITIWEFSPPSKHPRSIFFRYLMLWNQEQRHIYFVISQFSFSVPSLND